MAAQDRSFDSLIMHFFVYSSFFREGTQFSLPAQKRYSLGFSIWDEKLNYSCLMQTTIVRKGNPAPGSNPVSVFKLNASKLKGIALAGIYL